MARNLTTREVTDKAEYNERFHQSSYRRSAIVVATQLHQLRPSKSLPPRAASCWVVSVIDSMTMSASWTRVNLAVQTNQKGPGEKEPIC